MAFFQHTQLHLALVSAAVFFLPARAPPHALPGCARTGAREPLQTHEHPFTRSVRHAQFASPSFFLNYTIIRSTTTGGKAGGSCVTTELIQRVSGNVA